MSDHDITIYAVGVCAASACAANDVPLEAVAARANAEHPTGVGPWAVSGDEAFAGGEPNPCPCNDKPATHRHILLNC